MEYLFVVVVVASAFYYLIRKIRREIKKGQCASCPIYDKCTDKDKVELARK